MPGWHAQVGSSNVTVRSGGPFQSVAVGPGTTRVTFSFTPPYGNAALVAALAGMASILSTFAIGRRRRGRHRVGPVTDPETDPEPVTPYATSSGSDHSRSSPSASTNA
jgi:hypothetical protein